jgi:hypothetical protein
VTANRAPQSPAAPGCPPHVRSDLLDESGCVNIELPCDRCTYNLFTLHFTGRCPECGHPVEESVATAPLGYASSQYLRMLRHGLGLLTIALIILFGTAIVAGAFVVATGPRGSRTGLHLFMAMLVPELLAAIALWRIARPEPYLGQRGASDARALRGALLLASVAVILVLTLAVGQVDRMPYFVRLPVFAAALASGCVAVVLTPFMMLRFLLRLGERLGCHGNVVSAGAYTVIALVTLLLPAPFGYIVSSLMGILAITFLFAGIHELRQQLAVHIAATPESAADA